MCCNSHAYEIMHVTNYTRYKSYTLQIIRIWNHTHYKSYTLQIIRVWNGSVSLDDQWHTPVLLSPRNVCCNDLHHQGVSATSQLNLCGRDAMTVAFLSHDNIQLHKIKWRIFYEHQLTCADNQMYFQAPINLISFNVGDGFFPLLWTVEQSIK